MSNQESLDGHLIYIAEYDEKEELVDFFCREWKTSQIIVRDELFDYYYRGNERLNFVVARRECDQQLVGACGLIRCSDTDVWMSNLLVKKGEKNPIALKIMIYLSRHYQHISAVNLEKNTRFMYSSFLKWKVDTMKHYYKLFAGDEYKVAKISEEIILPVRKSKYTVKRIDTEDMCRQVINENHLILQRPYKSLQYIIKRYFHFPSELYHYTIYGIEVEKKRFTTFFVMREQQVADRKIARIVDIIGSENELIDIADFFESMGKERDYEYIDCLCYGISPTVMKEMGFVLNENETNIIPDRLDPLIQENQCIYVSFPKNSNYRFFHADGDMDRPNLV
ncbi:MAG: hypothetical protein NC355_04265 [Blautia sp.]|nr:hypothetical protein [Blautia sp.]